ncbi:MAG TPA: hypothetical protein LFV90_03015 [Rickettsia endosymbiont of Columbicola hoogstraali]|nr:hypothetical protein [Rickettsia endosymbiont of Columbicola hoogstraali]
MKSKKHDLSNLESYTDEDANVILGLTLQEIEIIKFFGSDNYCCDMKEALSKIGYCYKKLGNIEESKKYFEQAELYNSQPTQDIENIYSELLGYDSSED